MAAVVVQMDPTVSDFFNDRTSRRLHKSMCPPSTTPPALPPHGTLFPATGPAPTAWGILTKMTKRFTPTLIVRLLQQGRRKGTRADHVVSPRVTRGDLASAGWCHLVNPPSRPRDLPSDGGFGAQLLVTILHDFNDGPNHLMLSVP